MTFVTPLLLAGTALVALPIVLHLIMRQRPRLLEFPALRFIQKQHDANRRRLRLRHLILLLLRAAAIALLAFALARPSMRIPGSLGSQEAPVAAVMVFDAAPRMQYKHLNRTRIEAASEFGVWLLGQLPEQSQIGVLDTRLGPAVFQVDRGAAKQRIQSLGVVNNSQPLTAALDEAMRLVAASDLPQKEIYVFTDMASAAWSTDMAAALQQRIAELSAVGVSAVGVYLIDVGVEKPEDYSLGELRLSSQVLSARGRLTLRTDISRLGPSGRRTVELYLQDNNRKPQLRGEEDFALAEDDSREVEFNVGSLGVGTHQGFVRIVGKDGLADDDTRFFSVEVRPAWRILIAAPRPAQSYALYLAESLAPTMFRRQGQARFDCHVVDIEQLAQRPLDQYSAVCLLDPKPLEPAVWQKLGDYVSRGGGLAIFLGRNARPLKAFNSPGAAELLPATLLRQAIAADDVHLAPRSLEHPILSAFRGRAGSVPWEAFPVFRYWQLGKLLDDASVVAAYNDGRPAILERPLGAGRVLTMTTPISDRPDRKTWNLLPVGDAWPFVILTNEMMTYLVGAAAQQLNYYAGQTVVLELDADDRRESYLITAPDQMKFTQAADLKRHVLVTSATEQVGNYRVQSGGRASGIDRGFSVNLAMQQTQLARVDDEQLEQIFGPLEFRVARDRRQIDRDISVGRVGRELFPLLILLLALVLGAEHFLANRFYKESR